jgi:putative transposase
MPRMYPASVRRQIVARLREGEPVGAVAVDTGICEATCSGGSTRPSSMPASWRALPAWRLTSWPPPASASQHWRPELTLSRDACELFNHEAVVPPKRRRAIAEGLIARGHSALSACRITGLARSVLQYHRRRPVPDREIRRLIVADTTTEIHQRSRGTYGRRRSVRHCWPVIEMNVNHKLVNSVMNEHGLCGLPRPGRRLPNLIKVNTPEDLVKRRFTATRPR